MVCVNEPCPGKILITLDVLQVLVEIKFLTSKLIKKCHCKGGVDKINTGTGVFRGNWTLFNKVYKITL